MSEQEVIKKPWYSDPILGAVDTTTIINRCNIGPSSITALPISDSNKDGMTVKFDQSVNVNYIFDRSMYLSAKPTIIIKGITRPDTRISGANAYNNLNVVGGAGGGVNCSLYTGEGGMARFFLPDSSCLCTLPLNSDLENPEMTLNTESQTFNTSGHFINAMSHFASDEQKEGKGLGVFDTDEHLNYEYFCPTNPHLPVIQTGDVASRAVLDYPYKTKLGDTHEKNIMLKRHKKLPPYKTVFIDSNGKDLPQHKLNGVILPFIQGTDGSYIAPDPSATTPAVEVNHRFVHSNVYWGDLTEIIEFDEPIYEPFLHQWTKMRDDSSKIFLSNLDTFNVTSKISSNTSRIVRFSNGNSVNTEENLVQYSKTANLTLSPGNIYPVPNLETEPVNMPSTITSVSVDFTKAEWKLYLIQYSVPSNIPRNMITKLPFYKYETSSYSLAGIGPTGGDCEFPTKNLGSIPYYMLLYGVKKSDLKSNFVPDRRVNIQSVEVGLGTDDALLSSRFNKQQLKEMTRKNGLSYNFDTITNCACVRNKLQDVCIPTDNGKYLVPQTCWEQSNLNMLAPEYKDVLFAGSFILLNFTDDICSMSQMLAPGTQSNIPFNLKVNFTSPQCVNDDVIIYCHLIKKYELVLDRRDNSSSTTQELFSATDVLNSIEKAKESKVQIYDDTLIGGNFFGSLKNNFSRWLPKIKTAVSKGQDVYNDIKPHVSGIRQVAEQNRDAHPVVDNTADALSKLGFGRRR